MPLAERDLPVIITHYYGNQAYTAIHDRLIGPRDIAMAQDDRTHGLETDLFQLMLYDCYYETITQKTLFDTQVVLRGELLPLLESVKQNQCFEPIFILVDSKSLLYHKDTLYEDSMLAYLAYIDSFL